MAKIKFKLIKFEKRICFEILEQIRVPDNFILKTSCGIIIYAAYPYIEDINSNNLYIRSEKNANRDHLFSMKSFSSNEDRDKYYNLTIQALREFSEKFSN